MTTDQQEQISRRYFLRACLATGCTLPFAAAAPDAAAGPRVEYGGIFYEKKARNWEAAENNAVTCNLCPRHCTVPPGARGYCGVRENRDGVYYTLVWGNACAVNVDPIEKKPLFHVVPGKKAFSFATAGCNLKCKFCQNWSISQSRPEQTRNFDLPPAEIVAAAARHRCDTVAFTYNEPTIFHEYMMDTATLAKAKGLKPVVISNGFINEDPMIEMCKVMTAIKIDLKAFTNDFYKNVAGARLKPVLETLQLLKKQEMWFEIVNLVVPTLNDKLGDIRSMCQWIKKELGPDVPTHFTAFHPMYKLKNLPRTPNKTLFAAYDLARAEGLNFVYVGNVRPAGHRGEKTYCPGCEKVLVDRKGYLVKAVHIDKGKCTFCQREIPGAWE